MDKVLYKWVLGVLIVLFCLCMFFLINIFLEEYNVDKTIKKLQKDTIIEKTTKGELISIDDDINSIYWQYINIPFISVDFNELLNLNNDVEGWVQIAGTKVNYPIVKGDDNSFYINHSLNKKVNHVGWTFIDYKNTNESENMVIYTKGSLGSTILSSMKDVINKKWYSNKNNLVIKMSTLVSNSLWQVFSLYKTKTISDLALEFDNNEELVKYADTIKGKSINDFKVDLKNTIKMVTFVTKDNDEYIVLCAKLIKQEKR